MSSLRINDAGVVADEITRVIARGTTEEIEVTGKAKELSQRPLEPDEAYLVAAQMVIAALEPSVMKKFALIELESLMDSESSIVWQQDFVDKSPITPDSNENIEVPDIDGLEELEDDLRQVVRLMGEV